MGIDNVVELLKLYESEIVETVEGVRKRTAKFQHDIVHKAQDYQMKMTDPQQGLNEQTDKLLASVTAHSDIEIDLKMLMATFVWAGVLLIVLNLFYAVGRYLLAPVMGVFISPFTAIFLAYLAMPLLARYWLRKPLKEKKSERKDQKRRYSMFHFAVTEGVLTGFLYSDCSLCSWTPSAAGTMFCIGFGGALLSLLIGNSRARLVGLTLGVALVGHFSFGVMIGLTKVYLILCLLYTAVGFIMLQMYLQNVTSETKYTHIYQLWIVYMILLVDGAMMKFFGHASTEECESEVAPPLASDA